MGISVGTLTVNLEAQTSQFTSGLDKAGQQAKNFSANAQTAFNQASTSSAKFGTDVSYSMLQARGSLMIVESELGVHVPRALNTLISTIPGVGAAFASMLPLVGVIAAVAIIGKLINAHHKLQEEADKVTQSQASMSGAIATTFRGLEDKFLSAGIKADELRGNHLAALSKELQLIDNATLSDLEHSFDNLAKHADATFALMNAHWYQFGDGANRVKHNLSEFQSQYDLLLDTGDKGGAAKLLQERIDYEQHILDLQKEEQHYGEVAFKMGDYLTRDAAKMNELKAAGAGISENEIKSQTAMLAILEAQRENAKIIANTTDTEKSNTTIKDTRQDQSRTDSLALAQANAAKSLADANAQYALDAAQRENSARMVVLNAAIEAAKQEKEIDADSYNTKVDLIAKGTSDELRASTDRYNASAEELRKKLALLHPYSANYLADQATLNGQLEALEITHQGDLEKIQLGGDEKRATAEKEFISSGEAANKKAIEDAKKASDETAKFTETMLKGRMAAEKEAADYAYKSGKVSLDRHLADLRAEAAEELAAEIAKNEAIFDASKKTDDDILARDRADLIAKQKNAADLVKINQQANNTMIDGFKNFFNQYMNAGKTAAQQTEDVMHAAMTGMTDNLAGMITSGKAKWSDYVNTIENDLAKLAINQMLKSLFSLGTSLLGGGGIGSIASDIGPSIAMASGGPVSAGSLYTVGESGKEWFIPTVAGTIVPNTSSVQSRGGGNSTVINQNFNITTPNKDSFMASADQILGASQAAAFRAAKRNN